MNESAVYGTNAEMRGTSPVIHDSPKLVRQRMGTGRAVVRHEEDGAREWVDGRRGALAVGSVGFLDMISRVISNATIRWPTIIGENGNGPKDLPENGFFSRKKKKKKFGS